MDEVATRFQHPGLQVLRLVSTRMATQGKVQKCMGAPHTHTPAHKRTFESLLPGAWVV